MLNGCVLCTKSLLVKMLKCRTSKAYLGACLDSGPGDQDLDLDHMAFASGRFIRRSIMDILANKQAIQEWVRKTTPAITYVPVLLRLVIMLYMVTLTLQFGDCYEVTTFLYKCRIFKDLPPDFSKKIVPTLNFKSGTVTHFTRIFGDALAAIGNPMVVLGLPKGPLISQGLNACRISNTDLSDVNKVIALLCPEQKSPMQKGTKTWNVTSGNLPIARIQDNEMVSRIEMHLSDESISFWEKFESFQVFMHGQVS